jgi:methyl-accepting chemotaxis protein
VFNSNKNSTLLENMLDDIPTNVMVCDIENFNIIYANKASQSTLRRIEHVLPIKADTLVGSSIDVFHKNPSHQRQMLANPANLPHKARISIGGEILDLFVTAVRDAKGRYVRAMLTWDVVTEKVALEEQGARLLQMIEQMPINVMTCDPNDNFNIGYMNKTSVETLRKLEQYLPVRADDILGKSVDIFHKKPSHQRSLLADPRNLPHSANIQLGPEYLRLNVSAILGKDGSYIGPMLNWSVVTANV